MTSKTVANVVIYASRLFVLAVLLSFISSCNRDSNPAPQGAPQTQAEPVDPYINEYRRTIHPGRLYLPTFMGKLGGHYFIVDSYNNRVLYSSDKTLPVTEWKILDNDLSWPHSIASDGEFYVVDNTQAHELRVYRQTADEEFILYQTISDVGLRPHRTIYDSNTEAFYVLASQSQEMVKLQVHDNQVEVIHKQHLPFLNGTYVRSFALIEGEMYFVSGPKSINVVDYRVDSYPVIKSYPVPGELENTNDIHYTDGVFLVSASLNKLVRCRTLGDLSKGACESIYTRLGLNGNPYYFSVIDGVTHMSEIAGGDTIHELYQVGGADLHAKSLY